MAAINTLLPEEILEKVTCSFCKKYLSFGETKIYPSGEISCGRCCPEDKYLGSSSLHERVAPYLVFPCINHHNGCTKQLQYNEVEAHEKMCTNVAYQCPICPGTFEYTLDRLEKHFKIVHPKNVMLYNRCVYDLNINSFKKTDTHFLFKNPFLMLMFIKYDGQWLYLNVSVPYYYVLAKITQTVNNLEESKVCSVLGEKNDCFKFFLPRSLDCTADISFKVIKNRVEILIEFLPKDEDNSDARKVKTELPPHYLPKLCVGKDMKEYFETKYGGLKLEKCFEFSPCGKKIVNTKNPSISVQVGCDCCENYFWESPPTNLFKCQHFVVCKACFDIGYTNCKIDRAGFQIREQLDLVKLRFECRYNCGGIFKPEQITDHENTCDFNLLNSLSDVELGKLCFGSVFDEKVSFRLSNRFNGFDFSSNRLFFVTKDGRKFIVHYKVKQNKHWFLVEHDYDKKKYVAVIRIYCADNIFREEENSFFCNNSSYKNTDGHISFCIIFKDNYLY